MTWLDIWLIKGDPGNTLLCRWQSVASSKATKTASYFLFIPKIKKCKYFFVLFFSFLFFVQV